VSPRVSHGATFALAAAMLAACSSGPSPPSADEMRDAIQRDPRVMAGSMVWASVGGLFGGGSSAEDVRRRLTVARGDCVEARPNPGFVCDFAILIDGSRVPGGEARGRFFRIENQWTVELMLR
jgi:hypothetical protein